MQAFLPPPSHAPPESSNYQDSRLLPDNPCQLRNPGLHGSLGTRTVPETHGLASAFKELVPPAILRTLADLIFASDIRNGALASEPFRYCHHLGLRINLTAFHAYPLRNYSCLASCLSPKGSSVDKSKFFQWQP